MPSEKDKAAFDQGTAFLADSLPPQWRRFYNKCLEEGFSEEQSFRLVQTYIFSLCPYGVRGPE